MGRGLGSFTWCNWVFRLVAPWRPLGRLGCWLVWVNIRFCGCCGLRFRPYGGSLLQTPKSNQNALLLRSALAGSGSFAAGLIRAQRLRFASLHLLALCTTASYGRCAPTPGSIPPLSLPTGSQIKIKSGTRANAHRVELPKAAILCFCFCCPVGVSLLAKAA